MVRIMLKGGKGLPKTRRELHRDPEKTIILLVTQISSLAQDPLARRRRTMRPDRILIPGIGESTSSGNPKESILPPFFLPISSLNILPFPFRSFFPDKKQEHDGYKNKNKRVTIILTSFRPLCFGKIR